MRGITIRPLYHGDMHADRDLLVTGYPGGLLTAHNHGDDDRLRSKVWCAVPSYTYLVDHPDGKLLFDASISPHWKSEWLPEWQALAPYEPSEEQLFENLLKANHLGPEDIDILFLSHLHTDHAGNARLFRSSGTRIMMHEQEFAAAAERTEDAEFFLRADYEIPGARYHLLPGDVEIMKDVYAVSLPGHTAGTMGLMIHLEHSGTVILTSDACYVKESYDSEVGSMISLDLERWRRSMHKLKMLARCHNAAVIPGHDHRLCHEGESPLAGELEVRRDGVYA